MLSWSLRNGDITVEQTRSWHVLLGLRFSRCRSRAQPSWIRDPAQHLPLPRLSWVSRRSESQRGEGAERVTAPAQPPATVTRRGQLDTSPEPVAAWLAVLPATTSRHVPGSNLEIKQTWQRPIKLISSHFKLSISNWCFTEI